MILVAASRTAKLGVLAIALEDCGGQAAADIKDPEAEDDGS